MLQSNCHNFLANTIFCCCFIYCVVQFSYWTGYESHSRYSIFFAMLRFFLLFDRFTFNKHAEESFLQCTNICVASSCLMIVMWNYCYDCTFFELGRYLLLHVQCMWNTLIRLMSNSFLEKIIEVWYEMMDEIGSAKATGISKSPKLCSYHEHRSFHSGSNFQAKIMDLVGIWWASHCLCELWKSFEISVILFRESLQCLETYIAFI